MSTGELLPVLDVGSPNFKSGGGVMITPRLTPYGGVERT